MVASSPVPELYCVNTRSSSLVRVEQRTEFEEVVHLDVVWFTGKDLGSASGLVSIVATVLEVGSVFQFLLCWQFEDFLSNGELIKLSATNA